MSGFLSPKFDALAPYVPGEQPQDKKYVKLNTNESPFPPSPKVVETLSAAEVGKLNLYSDPTVGALCEAVADYYNARLKKLGRTSFLTKDNVFPGNGSDEVLAFIFEAYTDSLHGMAFPEVGYGCYPVFCGAFGAPFVSVPMKSDLQVDVAAFKSLKENITIANPNAQTGLYITVDEIKTLLSANMQRLVIIDEAYCDFGAESAVALLEEYPNLIVVQTMSKSRQLAGARVGFALASREIVCDLNRMKYSFNPYNLNRLSIVAGVAAIEDEEYFEKTTAAVVKTRENFKAELKALGFAVTDSLANFVLASKAGISGRELYLALKDKGVLVRFLSDEKLAECVRITIGSNEQMQILICKIKEILEERGI